MNSGIVSSRYAKAFLRYTEEMGTSDRVCLQVQSLLRKPDMAPESLAPEIRRLVELLVQKGRVEELRMILTSYVSQYFDSRNMKQARLVSAIPVEGLEDRVKKVLEEHFGCKVQIEVEHNPGILGGFVLEVGDYMLDASVLRQIESIRREFVINTNRIV